MRFSVAFLVVLVGSTLALAGCHDDAPAPDGGGSGPSDPPDGDGGSDDGETVAFRELARGQQSGLNESQRRVVTDPSEWQALWAEHAGEESKAPDVDFASERVIAVAIGQRPDGCHHVRVAAVTTDEEAAVTVVEVTEYVPGGNRACTEVITYPFHFVALPVDGTQVEFAERTEAGAPPAD